MSKALQPMTATFTGPACGIAPFLLLQNNVLRGGYFGDLRLQGKIEVIEMSAHHSSLGPWICPIRFALSAF
eukprot:1151866-Pelagomonas_calceolata.AAC.4